MELVCAVRLVHINCVDEPVKVARLLASAQDLGLSPHGWMFARLKKIYIFPLSWVGFKCCCCTTSSVCVCVCVCLCVGGGGRIMDK